MLGDDAFLWPMLVAFRWRDMKWLMPLDIGNRRDICNHVSSHRRSAASLPGGFNGRALPFTTSYDNILALLVIIEA